MVKQSRTIGTSFLGALTLSQVDRKAMAPGRDELLAAVAAASTVRSLLSLLYMQAGGRQEGISPEVEIKYKRARVRAWMARARERNRGARIW
jgi:hypothetical protein